MSLLRLGMIGAGAIAHYTAAEVVNCSGVQLSAVADPNAARAHELAQKQQISHCHASATELLANPAVDAVYIAVPNVQHAPLAIQALEAGKHVLLDKPFAMNAAQAEQVLEAAQSANRQFLLGMNTRFNPAVQKARALHAAERFGPVYHAKAQWRRRSGIPRIGSWFTHRAVAGGGALLDIGVHMLDAALYILDNFAPLSVSGVTENRFGGRGLGDGQWGRSERQDRHFDVDDYAFALIRLQGGISLTLETSWAMHQSQPDVQEIELFGEQAGAAVFQERLFHSGAENDQYQQQELTAPLAYAHGSRVQNFVNCIAGTEAPMVTGTQALAVQRILDAIYQSAQHGQEVRL